MHTHSMTHALFILATLAGSAARTSAQPELVPLDTLGGTYSAANSISGDGSTVVGVSSLAGNDAGRAFRWTPGLGMSDLHASDQEGGVSECATWDGSIIAGRRILASGHVPFVWKDGITTHLPALGGFIASVADISDDGSVAVGYSSAVGSYPLRACLWRDGDVFDLGTLGGPAALATGISGDGQVVVGAATDPAGEYKPFRWTVESGMQQLSPGAEYSGRAITISADGSSVIGFRWPVGELSQSEAIVWQNGVTTALGTLGGRSSSASCCNADGSLVGGNSYIENDTALRPFVWSPGRRMINLQEYLARSGIDVSGWDMRYISDFSHDGSVLIGLGYFQGEWRGFLVRHFTMPCPADTDLSGFVDTDDFTTFVLAFEAGTQEADFNGSGFVDTDDFTAYVLAFEAGC